MLCKRILEYLADDRIDDRVRDHLKACASCRKAAEDLAAQRALFREAQEQPVPDRVWQNIRDAVAIERMSRQESSGRGFLVRLWETIRPRRLVFATAGVCAMLAVALIISGIYVHQRNALGNEMILGVRSTDFVYDLGTSV